MSIWRGPVGRRGRGGVAVDEREEHLGAAVARRPTAGRRIACQKRYAAPGSCRIPKNGRNLWRVPSGDEASTWSTE